MFPADRQCSPANTVILTQPCEEISVHVTHHGQPLRVTKQPTCTDTTVTVQLSGNGRLSVPLQVTVTEYVSDDQWQTQVCEPIQSET
ncbi:hypothetical protein PGH45_19130 [Legionella pneumophila]|nr:hypothetical protein [Legionella pneumophila]